MDNLNLIFNDRLLNNQTFFSSLVISFGQVAKNIFSYNNLPDELDKRIVETLLYQYGKLVAFKYLGKLVLATYSVNRYDWYGNPSKIKPIAIYSNSYIDFSKLNLSVGEDCVLLFNNSYGVPTWSVLAPYIDRINLIFQKHYNNLINTDNKKYILSNDKNRIKALEKQLKTLELSSQSFAILSAKMIEQIKFIQNEVKDIAESLLFQLNSIIALTLKSIGVSASDIAKLSGQSDLQTDFTSASITFISNDYYESREIAFDKINKLFGYEIEVIDNMKIIKSPKVETELSLEDKQNDITNNLPKGETELSLEDKQNGITKKERAIRNERLENE